MGFIDRLENAKGRQPKGNCFVPAVLPALVAAAFAALYFAVRRRG